MCVCMCVCVCAQHRNRESAATATAASASTAVASTKKIAIYKPSKMERSRGSVRARDTLLYTIFSRNDFSLFQLVTHIYLWL